jgi:site-specific DNA-methyltransferase (adenine-specific)
MPELADGSVGLTVTSPPYWTTIDYAAHTSRPGENYRPRPTGDYAMYLDFLRRCFGEIFRVQRESAFCAVVIGTVLVGGKHIPLPFHFVSLMEEIGWIFHQDIIWSKCTGGVKRFRSTTRNPYPGYFYPNIMTEYILLFRKPGEAKIYEDRSMREKEGDRIALDAVTTRDVANNIWHIAPVPPKQSRQLAHPCPFPEEIPYRLIRWYSYRGDIVCDPFCGIGTTLKVAAAMGRRWIGYEIQPRYAATARRKIAEPLALRKQLIVGYERIGYGERASRARSGDDAAPTRSGDDAADRH